ncbi:MAG TPA: AAA family ATPase [Longimicrobium sp.]|nr:AAA family ATPase [Longimicrobium sp.]
MDKLNPFEYGRELGLDELVDRREEMAAIDAAIRNRGKLFLIGPRRFGKTSVLSAAGEAATRQGTVVLRFDAEKYESLELLAEALLTAAARALESRLDRAVSLISRAAGLLRPEARVDPEGFLSISIGGRSSRGALPVLTDALDAVESLAAESGRTVVVILDEVQQVVVEHGITAERQLRSTVQQHRHLGYIFAGSDTRLLTEMTSDPDRPFYRMGERIFLGALPRDEFLEFLENGFAGSGFSCEPGVCAHLLDCAEEVPYNVQRLAHQAWEMLRAAPGNKVTRQVVDDALERLVRREDPAYTQIWTTLRRNQKTAIKAIITERGKGMMSAPVARKHHISTASMQTALKQLEQASLIRSEKRDGHTWYRLIDPFFAAWLRLAQAS